MKFGIVQGVILKQEGLKRFPGSSWPESQRGMDWGLMQ